MAIGFSSYEIARSGLYVSERSLYTTGHNIANVNSQGYVRQQTMISALPYRHEFSKYGNYELGVGAGVQQVRQIRNIFLDNIYRQENTELGYWSARDRTLQDVQDILGEPLGQGLQSSMNEFWNSWQELSKEPESLTLRALVRQRGEMLIQHVNQMGKQLDSLQNSINNEVKTNIQQVNDIIAEIGLLNTQIMKSETSGDLANDYRDRRNFLIDGLSKIIDVDVREMQDGQISISLGGHSLLDKTVQTKLYAGMDETTGIFCVPMLEGTETHVTIKSGELKGLLESRGEVFGAKGSVENGSAYDKIDLVFAINRDVTAAQKADLISNVAAMVDSFKAKGIDVRLGYVDYDSAGYGTPVFASDLADFTAQVSAIPYNPTAGAQGLEAVKAAEGLHFRDNALKKFMVVTNSELSTASFSVPDMAKELSELGISTSIISAAGTVQDQLEHIAETSDSGVFDIGAMAALSEDMYNDVKNGIYNNVHETNNIISDLKNKLNLLINVFAREVNSLHSSGKTLDGSNGGNFFAAIDGSFPMEMGNLKIDDSLLDLNNIVASESGSTGDNTIALKIANLRNDALIGKSGEETSIDDFYNWIILGIGNIGREAATISENQLKMVQAADGNRQSISGVSMDEEMSNMMKFKFAYDASSRALNVIDEMMETIIMRMGLSGR